MISDLRDVIWTLKDSPICTMCGDRVPRFNWMRQDQRCEDCHFLGDRCLDIIGTAETLDDSIRMRNERQLMLEEMLCNKLTSAKHSDILIRTHHSIARDTKQFKIFGKQEKKCTTEYVPVIRNTISRKPKENIGSIKIRENMALQNERKKRYNARVLEEKRQRDDAKKLARERYNTMLDEIDNIRECNLGICDGLKVHHTVLQDDPERLTTDFLIGIICGESKQAKYRATHEQER